MYKSVIFVFFLVTYLAVYQLLPVEDVMNGHLILETSYGKVRGNLLKSKILDIKYYAFHSIPYAAAPIGDLRFKEPSPIGTWKGILNATSMPKICPQPFLSEDQMSEDCLYLNIFTPFPRPNNPLPVIFWIHGGFFLFGNGRITSNQPDLFVNENVILVSINYRLGVFGFLSYEDDVLPGNYGIKDQIMALNWVHDNIGSFGGDSSKITLMGQSAGAAMVGLLLQTPSTQGLFSAAIIQSGNSLNLWSRARNPKSMADNIAKSFNVKYANSQDLMKQLQKIDWADLVNKTSTLFLVDAALANPANGFPFGPAVEKISNGVVHGKSHEKLRNGNFNRVSILTGFNSAETNFLISVFDRAPLYLRLYDIEPSRLVPRDLNANSSQLNDIGKAIKTFYFGSASITASKQLFINFLDDHEFIRPVNEFVRLLSGYTDTYFYRFSYVGHLPVVKEVQRELPGAVHSEELGYFFYSPNQNTPTAADLLTRKRLVKLWTNFAKYHNPTPTRDTLLQNITWKPVQMDEINYLNIGTDLQLLQNPSEKNITFWRRIYDIYGNPPYDTY